MGVALLFFPNIDDDACPLERLSAIGDGDDRFGIDEEEQGGLRSGAIKSDVFPVPSGFAVARHWFTEMLEITPYNTLVDGCPAWIWNEHRI